MNNWRWDDQGCDSSYVWRTYTDDQGEEWSTNIHLSSDDDLNERDATKSSTATRNKPNNINPKIQKPKKLGNVLFGKKRVKEFPSNSIVTTFKWSSALNFEDDAHINDSSDSDCDNDEDEEELIIRNIKDGSPLFEFKICYDLKFPSNNCYKMTSIPRGKVLVYNFNDKKRLGSEFDVKNLNNIFLRLGYKVKIIEDCTAEIFKKTLREECNEKDLESMDSFILFIMTHGTSKHLYMQDGREIQLNYVEEQLDGKNAPLLINKPKLIFVQACRDGNESSTSQIEWDAREEKQPHHKADILLSHSTYIGFKSARITGKGTLFIRALVLVLEKHAHEWTYSDIMLCVQRIVNRINLQDHTQMPQKTDSARYNFFFSPIEITSLIAQANSE